MAGGADGAASDCKEMFVVWGGRCLTGGQSAAGAKGARWPYHAAKRGRDGDRTERVSRVDGNMVDGMDRVDRVDG